MKIIKSENLSESQKQRIVALWNAEYPARLRHSGTASFDEYLSKLGAPEHYLLVDENENVKGWLCCFVRDGGKWFAMIVDTTEQKKGYGSRLLNEVKKFENELNGWAIDGEADRKANGEKYPSPLGFYEKNEFKIFPEIKFENQQMSAIKILWRRS